MTHNAISLQTPSALPPPPPHAGISVVSHLLRILDKGPAENPTQRRHIWLRQDGRLFPRKIHPTGMWRRASAVGDDYGFVLFGFWLFPEIIGRKSITRASNSTYMPTDNSRWTLHRFLSPTHPHTHTHT